MILPVSGLLLSVWQSPRSSKLLQTTLFYSFYGWVIFHCIYVPHLLYPFICPWPFRLLPCLGYWYSYNVSKTFCNEQTQLLRSHGSLSNSCWASYPCDALVYNFCCHEMLLSFQNSILFHYLILRNIRVVGTFQDHLVNQWLSSTPPHLFATEGFSNIFLK